MPNLSNDEYNFLDAMKAAVVDKGQDYVYDNAEAGEYSEVHTCTYVNYRDGGKTGSCIVGRGLLDSGLMSLTALEGYEGTTASIVVPFEPDSNVAKAAEKMQNQQDSGSTWAAAFMYGIGVLEGKGYNVADFVL